MTRTRLLSVLLLCLFTRLAANAQAPSEAAFVRLGVQRSLEGPGGGAAPIEGAER